MMLSKQVLHLLQWNRKSGTKELPYCLAVFLLCAIQKSILFFCAIIQLKRKNLSVTLYTNKGNKKCISNYSEEAGLRDSLFFV